MSRGRAKLLLSPCEFTGRPLLSGSAGASPYRVAGLQMDPGGTANLAVLGGNLPPSFGTRTHPPEGAFPAHPTRRAGGPFLPAFVCMVPAQAGGISRQTLSQDDAVGARTVTSASAARRKRPEVSGGRTAAHSGGGPPRSRARRRAPVSARTWPSALRWTASSRLGFFGRWRRCGAVSTGRISRHNGSRACPVGRQAGGSPALRCPSATRTGFSGIVPSGLATTVLADVVVRDPVGRCPAQAEAEMSFRSARTLW